MGCKARACVGEEGEEEGAFEGSDEECTGWVETEEAEENDGGDGNVCCGEEKEHHTGASLRQV